MASEGKLSGRATPGRVCSIILTNIAARIEVAPIHGTTGGLS